MIVHLGNIPELEKIRGKRKLLEETIKKEKGRKFREREKEEIKNSLKLESSQNKKKSDSKNTQILFGDKEKEEEENDGQKDKKEKISFFDNLEGEKERKKIEIGKPNKCPRLYEIRIDGS